MRGRLLAALLLAPACTGMARAEPLQFGASVTRSIGTLDDERVSTSVPVSLGGTLMGWDTEIAFDWRRSISTRPDRRETRDRNGRAFIRRHGLTDMEISMERSIPLKGDLALDLLNRVTLPTGTARQGLGDKQTQLMVDAGLSLNRRHWSAWAGIARRFRTASAYAPGRDVWERYAGAEFTIDRRTTVRTTYVRTQRAYAGEPAESSFSVEAQRRLGDGPLLRIGARRERDYLGTAWRAGLTMEWSFRVH